MGPQPLGKTSALKLLITWGPSLVSILVFMEMMSTVIHQPFRFKTEYTLPFNSIPQHGLCSSIATVFCWEVGRPPRNLKRWTAAFELALFRVWWQTTTRIRYTFFRNHLKEWAYEKCLYFQRLKYCSETYQRQSCRVWRPKFKIPTSILDWILYVIKVDSTPIKVRPHHFRLSIFQKLELFTRKDLKKSYSRNIREVTYPMLCKSPLPSD